MNRVKCSGCGFVAFSSEEACKKCKQSLLTTNVGSKTRPNAPPEVQEDSSDAAVSLLYGFLGLLMMGGSFFIYNVLDNFEKSGGSIRMNVLFILMYKIGGKWLVSIIIALIGFLIMAMVFIGNSEDKENQD